MQSYGKAIFFNVSNTEYADYTSAFSDHYGEVYFRTIVSLETVSGTNTYDIFAIASNFEVKYDNNTKHVTVYISTSGATLTLVGPLTTELKSGPLSISFGYDSSNAVLKLNGIIVDKKPLSGELTLSNPIMLGNSTSSSDLTWAGIIDDTVLHDNVPSSFDMSKNDYEFFGPSDTSSYKHVWNMDQQDPAVISDVGNEGGLDLTLHGGTYVEGLCRVCGSTAATPSISVTAAGGEGKSDYYQLVSKNSEFVYTLRHSKSYGVGVRVWKVKNDGTLEPYSTGTLKFINNVWVYRQIMTEVGIYRVEFYTRYEGVIVSLSLYVKED